MPSPKKYHVDFVESEYYHFFNRTNNQELLFRSDYDYQFFLKRWDEYITPIAETYAWCLLPNHFHVLIRIKAVDEISAALARLTFPAASELKYLVGSITLSELIALTFKRFFQSYTLSFNKAYSRSGNLFYKTFRRTHVERDEYFTQTVLYIHANPIKHGIVKKYAEYRWSSWRSSVSSAPTKLKRQEVLDWFGGPEAFLKAHELELEKYLR